MANVGDNSTDDSSYIVSDALLSQVSLPSPQSDKTPEYLQEFDDSVFERVASPNLSGDNASTDQGEFFNQVTEIEQAVHSILQTNDAEQQRQAILQEQAEVQRVTQQQPGANVASAAEGAPPEGSGNAGPSQMVVAAQVHADAGEGGRQVEGPPAPKRFKIGTMGAVTQALTQAASSNTVSDPMLRQQLSYPLQGHPHINIPPPIKLTVDPDTPLPRVTRAAPLTVGPVAQRLHHKCSRDRLRTLPPYRCLPSLHPMGRGR